MSPAAGAASAAASAAAASSDGGSSGMPASRSSSSSSRPLLPGTRGGASSGLGLGSPHAEAREVNDQEERPSTVRGYGTAAADGAATAALPFREVMLPHIGG